MTERRRQSELPIAWKDAAAVKAILEAMLVQPEKNKSHSKVTLGEAYLDYCQKRNDGDIQSRNG